MKTSRDTDGPEMTLHTTFKNTAGTDGKRPGKRERTRAELLDGAVAVIAAKGMANTKISDITEMAGLANGTFYNHFEDRDEILREVAYRIAYEIGRQIDEDMKNIDDAITRVTTATARFISMALEAPDWGAVLIGTAEQLPDVRSDIMRYLKSDLALGAKQGKFDITLDQFLLDQIAALIVISIRTQLGTGFDQTSVSRTCENVLRVCGLTPSAALRAVAKTSVATP